MLPSRNDLKEFLFIPLGYLERRKWFDYILGCLLFLSSPSRPPDIAEQFMYNIAIGEIEITSDCVFNSIGDEILATFINQTLIFCLELKRKWDEPEENGESAASAQQVERVFLLIITNQSQWIDWEGCHFHVYFALTSLYWVLNKKIYVQHVWRRDKCCS